MSSGQHASDSPADGPMLAGLAEQPPAGFGVRVLRRAGIPREVYDVYVRLDTAAGGLFVASGQEAVTGTALDSGGLDATAFEELHRVRTGRPLLSAARPLPGVVPALRTGRARRLRIDLSPLDPVDRDVLEAVRAIPAGQLRPIGWIAREAGAAPDEVLGGLARNPATVLIPGHRAVHDDGTPCDLAHPPGAAEALRAAEGIDMRRMAELLLRGAVFLGSDTTRIYCHPTCAHARRITRPHQVPFRTAREAGRAGYRACRSCRPVTV
ncbi:Ada metal-binding domain-containing protein [Streptomyces sp. NPDC004111]|uniref:Ada metal-binding domain-containing protein n=1 Tax=Streptomyces sp. NPDC004111 TaxID=3364690 RepID=UPI00368213C7